MKAIIPAAGYATRLHPLTKDQPKHLLDVKGKAIIEHIIDKIEEIEDVDEILVVTNEKFFDNFQKWAEEFECDIPIRVFNDGTTSNDDRLGQIGDIHFALEKGNVDDDVMIIAGDNLFNFSLHGVKEVFYNKRSNVNALYDVRSRESAKQLGIATIDNEQKIVGFHEKPEEPKSTLASIGIYLFPKENVQLFSNYLNAGNKPDKMGYFMEWLIQNDELHGHVYTEKWFDIGWHESLEEARREFEG